jgi:hypothetical protein
LETLLQKICEVWSEFNIFCTLVTMATVAILNFFNPQKLPHVVVDISIKFKKLESVGQTLPQLPWK